MRKAARAGKMRDISRSVKPEQTLALRANNQVAFVVFAGRQHPGVGPRIRTQIEIEPAMGPLLNAVVCESPMAALPAGEQAIQPAEMDFLFHDKCGGVGQGAKAEEVRAGTVFKTSGLRGASDPEASVPL